MSYGVLLADDENIFLEFLTGFVDWEGNGCYISGVAKTGEEAFELIKQTAPDIVFLDINMPKIDGLTLCRMLNELDIKPRVIIMTAHNEFSFAHQSIKLGVFDYLLKPFDSDELLTALNKCILDISKERELRRKEYERFFRDLIQTGATSRLVTDNTYQELSKRQANFLVTIVKPSTAKACDEDYLSILSAYEDVFAKEMIESFVAINDDIYLVVVHILNNSNTSVERVVWCYEHLLDLYDNLFTTIAVGSSVQGLRQISNSYENANIAFENSVKYEQVVVSYDILQELNTQYASYSSDDINLLVKYYKQNQYDRFGSIIERMFGLESGQMFSLQYAISVYHSLFINISGQFNRHKSSSKIDEYIKSNNSIMKDLMECVSTTQMVDTLKDYICRMFNEYVGEALTKKDTLVEKVETYLQENYMNSGLTVDDVAKHIFFENSYVRRTYKALTGQTIIHRLEDIRIERAKLLLQEGYKHSDIATMAGFSNQSYFSKRFKLICGYTPSEYQLINRTNMKG